MADLFKMKSAAILANLARANGEQTLQQLFNEDPDRMDWGVCEAAGLRLNITKQVIPHEAFDALIMLADECDVVGSRDRMAAGDNVNVTEGRAALHMALRNGLETPVNLDGEDILATVRDARTRLMTFADRVRSGTVTGATGKAFTRVIHIGIGGSDLGPRLVVDALSSLCTFAEPPRFVANADAAELTRALEGADPEATLILVASKTFTTEETMLNARSAIDWLQRGLPADADAFTHVVALTANEAEAKAFGVSPERIFPFWSWVGGRFSLWSSVGLSIAISLGAKGFNALLAGAAAMDRHFLTAPLAENLPVVLALVGVWNRSFNAIESQAVVPYAQGLEFLPAYLQQLEMESNGKAVSRDGDPVAGPTAPVVWGGAGTTGQHAFFQWLHQGTDRAACDIILPLNTLHGYPEHHDIVVAHAIAQAEALAFGRNEEATHKALADAGLSATEIDDLAPHRTFPGIRPVTVLTMEALTPATLGALLALYEHKVFVQAVLWDINPFDQWGVELGKQVAGRVQRALKGETDSGGFDPSTQALIDLAKKARAPKTDGN
jgi:glucose-6-phosphate isomerase